jgi:nicotinamide/nicotinate riboside kinase
MNRAVIIGLSGCSNSGKTTLATQLSRILPNCKMITQDEYFYHESTGLVEYISDLKMYNYDVINSIDMKKLAQDLNSLLFECDFIVLEGFLLYSDDFLVKLIDKMYFITNVSKEMCENRRINRNYLGNADENGYFDKYVWTNYLKYQEECKKLNITYLNGHETIENLVNFVMNDLKLSLKLN